MVNKGEKLLLILTLQFVCIVILGKLGTDLIPFKSWITSLSDWKYYTFLILIL